MREKRLPVLIIIKTIHDKAYVVSMVAMEFLQVLDEIAIDKFGKFQVGFCVNSTREFRTAHPMSEKIEVKAIRNTEFGNRIIAVRSET